MSQSHIHFFSAIVLIVRDIMVIASKYQACALQLSGEGVGFFFLLNKGKKLKKGEGTSHQSTTNFSPLFGTSKLWKRNSSSLDSTASLSCVGGPQKHST